MALSLTSRATFAERVAAFGRPSPHVVLIWHFRDLIHPYMVLASPHEVTAFDFNPQHMEVVVGGCANGQVIMWELTEEILARAAQVRQCWTVQLPFTSPDQLWPETFRKFWFL